MEKQDLIMCLQKELDQSAWDIKAEHLCMLAIKKGLGVDDFMFCCDHFFKREFSRDVFSTTLKEDSKKQQLLELHLSRAGLFDQLPEGLFFQMAQSKSRQTNVDQLAYEYKQNKKKEEELRRFFLPFDNTFFTQRLYLEQEESALLEGLRTGILNDYFIRFWDLPISIPKMFLVPLVLLLPHAHKIAGNLKLTGACLGYLLKEKVVLVKRNSPNTSAESIIPPSLGEGRLGLSLVCGEAFFEDNPVIEIKIGPLKNSKIKDYLDGGNRSILIGTFNRFFIPAGLDVITTLKLTPEIEDMKESDYAFEPVDMFLEKGSEPVLGYSTVLG